MDEILYFFLESIGLEEIERTSIINNIGGNSIEEKVKSSISFILEKNENVNKEVEKKVLEVDIFEIIGLLEYLGAKKVFGGWIKDNRYDFSNKVLSNSKIFFRTRETSSGDFITFKKQILNNNCSKDTCSEDDEFEVEVKDINKVITAITALGMNAIKNKKYIKHRISYELDGVHFDFDRYDDIPWFLEIESDNEDSVNKRIKKLGLGSHMTVNYGYRKLKEHYEGTAPCKVEWK